MVVAILPRVAVVVSGKSFSNAQQMKFVYPTMTLFMAIIVEKTRRRTKLI